MALLDLPGGHGAETRPARDADGRLPWAKNPSGAGAQNGTRIDATFVNDLLGLFRGLMTAAGISPNPGDDNALRDAVTALIAASPLPSHNHDGRYYTKEEVDGELAGVDAAIAGKVATGADLSDLTDGAGFVRMTDSERSKLAALAANYRGAYASMGALESAFAEADEGDWAILTHGAGEPATFAAWDSDDDPPGWIDTGASAPASIDWASITGKPSTFPPSSHNHDDRYYTESEVDSALSGKVGTSRAVSAGTGLTGGGNLTADRTISASIASEPQAAAGSATNVLMTPQRTAQAIAALAPQSKIVSRAYAEYTTSANLNNVIPADDTIPQSTEGTEILSASLTPSSASNRVRVTFTGFGAMAGTTDYGVIALFQNSDANALIATASQGGGVHTPVQFSLVFEHVPGTTSEVTYKIRAGRSGSTDNFRLNGIASTRRFGGAARCTLVLEEIVP